MPSPYLDDDGEPRYGRRASPEELEAIRREQGIDAPAAGGNLGRAQLSLRQASGVTLAAVEEILRGLRAGS